ncbi:MAG: hypothetical protein M3362_06405, partial [Acidobacteriota bacterium]|nr:hypothetical protein [Acidobacteriota bacterium]
ADPVNVDRALNIMAHLFVGYIRTTFKGIENSLDVKLLRRETLDGRPAKAYAYTHTSCSGREPGVFVVYAGRTNFYTVHIDGASESDPRAQRLLKSIRFK